jgi:hypothetical protein
MNLDEDIVQKDLCDLLSYFSKQTYSASNSDQKVKSVSVDFRYVLAI